MYAEYKNIHVHGVQGMYMEYGDCTRSMEMYKIIRGGQAYDEL